jgi:hypothetical protein
VLFVPKSAFAREAPSVDEEEEPDDLDQLGPRGNLRTRADQVSFEARDRALELSGNVRIDGPPFHLRSDRIRLVRTKYGLEIDGKGTLAFCPCLGTPLTIDFDHAIVAPPGDVVISHPTLRVYDVPVFYLPYFWLRSDEKIGLLPPDIAYRGADGMFVGGGVHLPWKAHGEKQSLDLRGGAYLFDGFVADARLRTPTSFTKIRYDRLPSQSTDDGVLVDSRGAMQSKELGVAWDVDAIRGKRGVLATTELDAAAKPWDRAAAEGALRMGPVIVAQGVRIVTRRGGGAPDVDAAGPYTSMRVAGAAASGVTYDATIEGGALRTSGLAASLGAPTPETLSFARAEIGALAATSIGPLAASLTARGAGDVAAQSQREGGDRAAQARAHLGVPLARRFGDAPDPLLHVIEPFAEAAVLHAHGDGLLEIAPGRGSSVIDGTAPITEVGVTTSLGHWARRDAFELGVAGGAAYGSNDAPAPIRPLVRARTAASIAWLGLSGESAWVATTPSGLATIGRARLGALDGVRLLANVASRSGIDPVLARLLSDAPLEPPTGLLALAGTTGGASLVVPWSRLLTTSLGADGDATNRELVAARAGIELRDRCQCVTLRANAAHRIGRSGVDVWLAFDFASNR